MKKFSEIVKKILGAGILILLVLGGAAVIGYIVAFIIGGTTGADIVTFLYERYFVWLTYAACALVILGLVRVYLTGEHDFVLGKKKDKNVTETTELSDDPVGAAREDDDTRKDEKDGSEQKHDRD